MIAADKKEIRGWFEKGMESGSKYMLVVYDQMEPPDEMDSPCYAVSDEDALETYSAYNSDMFCTVMEVYNLTLDMETQLAEKRAWHLPDLSEQAEQEEESENN